jgi:hypothetical protein
LGDLIVDLNADNAVPSFFSPLLLLCQDQLLWKVLPLEADHHLRDSPFDKSFPSAAYFYCGLSAVIILPDSSLLKFIRKRMTSAGGWVTGRPDEFL